MLTSNAFKQLLATRKYDDLNLLPDHVQNIEHAAHSPLRFAAGFLNAKLLIICVSFVFGLRFAAGFLNAKLGLLYRAAVLLLRFAAGFLNAKLSARAKALD